MFCFACAVNVCVGMILYVMENAYAAPFFVGGSICLTAMYLRLYVIWLINLFVNPHHTFVDIERIEINPSEIGLYVTNDRYVKYGWGSVTYVKKDSNLYKIGFIALPELIIDERTMSAEEIESLNKILALKSGAK